MRESFQEFDPNAWFGTQTKRVFVIDEAERASEVVAEAFFAAKSGRPGPVVVGLPEDVITHDFTGRLHQPIAVGEGACLRAGTGAPEGGTGRRPTRPLIFSRRPALDPGSLQPPVTRFAETNSIPVIQDWHAADRIPFESRRVNAGSLGYGRTDTAARMFEEADVLLAIGAVPTDVPTDGFTLRQSADAVNILVSIDTSLRGRSGAVTSHIIASPVAFAQAVEGHQSSAWRGSGTPGAPPAAPPRRN
jgi:acetolactate synthase-1/2/3 large subunit